MSTYPQYTTAQRKVEAVQVTADNMNELAGWSGGRVKMGGDGRPYIQIAVKRGQPEKFGMAFATDWIVAMGKSFRVYTNDAFGRSFDELKQDAGTPLFDRLVLEIKAGQPISIAAEDTADRVMKLFSEAKPPSEIMGRPYLPQSGGLAEVTGTASIETVPQTANIDHISLEEAMAEPKRPVLPQNFFEVMHEGMVEVEKGPDGEAPRYSTENEV